MITLLQSDEYLSIGKARQLAHPHGATRLFSNDALENIVGAKGECAFAQAFGLIVDDAIRPEGDGGADFIVRVGGRRVSIDVKTFANPINLLVKVSDMRQCADILVLAKDCGGRTVVFLGWETRGIMSLMPTRDFGAGVPSHYRAASKLRRMWQLEDILASAEVLHDTIRG